jgi:hypothetical protein
MKKGFLSCLGWAILALAAVSCAQEDINIKEENNNEERKSLTIKVIDDGYQNKTVTRASESNEEEIDGESTIMRTRFIAGDKIGVFSISSGGATHYKNLELVYDGTNWKNPEGETFFFFSGMKYFAYYPYAKDFDMDKLDWSRNSAAGFFANYINDWMPLEDQSTTKNYIASDLMVGDGALTEGNTFTFSLGHAMGLIFISAAEELKGTVYLFPKLTEADAMENFSEDSKLYYFEQKVYKPSRRQGYYRYLVKPGQPTFISGMNPEEKVFSFTCENVSGGHYKKYVIDDGFDPSKSEIEDFTVRIGDILFNDMHIEHRHDDGSTVSGSKAGIIAYLAELNDEYTEGYLHGLVLAGSMESVGGASYSCSWTYDQFKDEMADNPIVANCINAKQAMNDKSGLTNSLAVGSTQGLRDLTRDHTTTQPIYKQASKWFTLSAGQWIKILEAWGATLKGDPLQTGSINFNYMSNIRQGTTSFSDDFKYLWMPYYAITNKDESSNPTANKYYAISSTESNEKGSAVWMFKMSSYMPYGTSVGKSSSNGRVWRGFAF